jgi:hypothetical protein
LENEFETKKKNLKLPMIVGKIDDRKLQEWSEKYQI